MRIVLLFLISLTISSRVSAQRVQTVEKLYNALNGQPSIERQECTSCTEKKNVAVYGPCQREKLTSCNGADCASLYCEKINNFDDLGTQLVFTNCNNNKIDECLKKGHNVSSCNKLFCHFYSKTPSKFFNIAQCSNPDEVKVCQKYGGGKGCILNKCVFYSLSEYKELASRGRFEGNNISSMPYFSQYDNAINPGASCQNTSIAMVLNYLHPNAVVKPDNLTAKYGNDLGKTPEGVVSILRNYGVKAKSTRNASIDTLKKQLSLGRPVIINGYFTKSGHVMVVTGYDQQRDEFIVNDPAGLWAGYYGGGYPQPGVNGRQAHYKSSAFRDAVMPDGKIWMAVASLNGEDIDL